jgi:hypothetical protein
MAWIPTLKRDPELNAWTWTILDVAMVRVHAAVIVLICNGVASQIVKEKTLVAHFARTNDRFSSLVAERKKLCVCWTNMHRTGGYSLRLLASFS